MKTHSKESAKEIRETPTKKQNGPTQILNKALLKLLCHDAITKGLTVDEDYWISLREVFEESSIA